MSDRKKRYPGPSYRTVRMTVGVESELWKTMAEVKGEAGSAYTAGCSGLKRWGRKLNKDKRNG